MQPRALFWCPPICLAACAPVRDVEVASRDRALTNATVWATPTVLQYRSVVQASEEHAENPNFTVFIELPNGTAGDIDPASVTLNGTPALSHPSALGDQNHNGVPDLMVKFDRSVFDGNVEGLFSVSGHTSSGSFSGSSQVRMCVVSGVERSTYFIQFQTSNMPDGNFNGKDAELEVRRVRPLFGPSQSACENQQAIVLVNGRTTEATATFDLQYPPEGDDANDPADGVDANDYSLLEGLAKRGIDAYAPNTLGYGGSRIKGLDGTIDETGPWNPLANACNVVILPNCTTLPGATCTPIPGQCECHGVPPSNVVQTNFLLGGRPLTEACGHTSNVPFQRTANQVADLKRVIDDVKERTNQARVTLLGYSAGGVPVGMYLGDPNDPAAAPDGENQAKIERAIFLASLFNQPDEPPELPAWPLGLTKYAPDTGAFSSGCPGQRDAGIINASWAQMRSREMRPPGQPAPWLNWGPERRDPNDPSGQVVRWPVVSRTGWKAAAARRITIPILAMYGAADLTVPGGAKAMSYGIATSSTLDPIPPCSVDADCPAGYACETGGVSGSPSVASKCRPLNRAVVEIPCASHGLLWETCSGPSCVDPHKQVLKLVGDYVMTGTVLAN